VAEHTRKPLYPINIGELTSDDRLVSRLQMHFDRAAAWDAVLLLDEADVLLEKRSYENLKRNGIVSVFLRMIEYYEGILFLTTNRIICMDAAFQSRIQLAIKYSDLTPDARAQIWKTFIDRLHPDEETGKRELLDELESLAEWPLNGRQIRNVMSTAEGLALSTGRRRGALRYKHVEEIANDTMGFDEFFEDDENRRKGIIETVGVQGRQFQQKRHQRFTGR
jgi:SpoVK/Ycf46/Vps4 family AAA+-type ATPase